MEDSELISMVLSSIAENPQIWGATIKNLLNELYKLSDSNREKIIDQLARAAIAELPTQKYAYFLGKVVDGLSELDEKVRASILSSSLITPTGFTDEEKEKVADAISVVLRTVVLEDGKKNEATIKAVITALLNMEEKDATIFFKSVSARSLELETLDYIKYSSNWLNILGELDQEEVNKILKERKNAIATFSAAQRQKGDMLIVVALLFVSQKARQKIEKAMAA